MAATWGILVGITNKMTHFALNTGSGGNTEIPAIPPGVKITTLQNGLTIIVREDHSAPVVSAQAWAMTGSINEGNWLGAGLSHVLEHMLFKGTTTRGAGRIDQEVQDAGGYMNAYTSFDRTVYYIDVPNTGARTAIDILCDIMQNASLPADEMVKEKDVILREMDMNQDDPGRRSSRRLFETAFTKSPYRFTIIGYPDIYNQIQRVDVEEYYRQRYAPNNVFYVVVGDIKAADVIAQITEAYSKAKSRAIPPATLPDEPRQTSQREVIEEAPIEMGHVHFSWHIPSLRDPDAPILDVLACILGNGRSSRLFREIREKKALAHGIDAWTYSPGCTGLFGVSAMVDPGNFTAMRDAVLSEIERLKQEPVSSAELSKAVKQFISGTLSSRKTMAGQAQDLGGSWISAHDLNFSERYLASVHRVTPQDLQHVARKHLAPSNRTLYALLPKGTSPDVPFVTDICLDHPINKFELSNGLRLLVKENHRLPFVEIRALFKGGVLAETLQNNGLSQLTGKMLLKGTTTRSAEQISSEIESVGGSIDSFGANNSFGVSVEVLSSDLEKGLELLADVILNPAFPEGPLEREREIQLASIKSQRDQLLKSAGLAMRRAMFGETGYGLDSPGSESSVKSLSQGDLKAFHQKFTVPNNCVLAIYGDVKTASITEAVEKTFANWRAGEKYPVRMQSAPQLNEIKRVVETRDKKQAVLLIGFTGSTIYDEDRYALEVLQESCSDLGSRLFMRIRDKLGLAYYVGAQNFLGIVPGYFAFYAGTAPEKIGQVEKEILSEVETLRTEGLTAEELKRAKAKIVGQRKISRQDLGSLAMTTGLDELLGLGFNHGDIDDAKLETITLEQVKTVARKYLNPEALVISIVRP
jgi:zinc protease